MQVNFFAAMDDWIHLWTWILEVPGMQALERWSRPDQPNRRFGSIDEIAETILTEGHHVVAAWPSGVGGALVSEQVRFDREIVRTSGVAGRTNLYSPVFITFMQHGQQREGCLSPGFLSCWSEAGARERSIFSETVLNAVDWRAFASITRAITRKIRTSSPAKIGGASIMPDAMRGLEAGSFSLWAWGEVVDATSPLITRR